MKKFLIAFCFLSFISCQKVETKPIDTGIIASESILLDKKEYISTNSITTIGFMKDKIYGFTGINNFNADYIIKDNRLVIDRMGITLATGSPNEIKIEREFLDILNNNTKFEIKDKSIEITDKNGKIHKFMIKEK